MKPVPDEAGNTVRETEESAGVAAPAAAAAQPVPLSEPLRRHPWSHRRAQEAEPTPPK